VRRAALIAALLLALTGCQNVADVKRDAEFTKVCKDGGGRVAYNDLGGIFCRFNEVHN